MKIKNFQIEDFVKCLFDLKLSGKKSRIRTRFIQLLNDHLANVEKERLILVEEYAMRDEHGQILLNESKTEVVLIPDKVMEFNKEFVELLNEDLIIEENEKNREMLTTLGETLLDYEIELSGEEAARFDDWCIMFEDIIERYSKN